MLPHEKHEFSAGWRAAQKGGPAGCTTGWASGLQIKAVCTLTKLGCGKGWAGGLPFSADRPALFRSPTDRLFCAARPSVLCAAARRKFTFPFGNTALQLVLSNRALSSR